MTQSDASSIPPEPGNALNQGSCPNCGSTTSGAYCATCGQRTGPLRLSIVAATRENASELLGLDGRIWRTFATLLFKPGRLTRAYIEGRRASHLRPLRVYLTASVLCFLLLALVDPLGKVLTGISGGEQTLPDSLLAGAFTAQLDSLIADADSLGANDDGVDPDSAASVTFSEAMGVPAPDGGEYGPDSADIADIVASATRPTAAEVERWRVQRHLLDRIPADSVVRPNDIERAVLDLVPDESGTEGINIELFGIEGSSTLQAMRTARPGAERVAALSRFAQESVRRIPTVLFLILPLFALLLKLIYIRRDWYYSEHLVFALHAHAVVFFSFSLVLAVQAVSTSAAATTLAGVSIGIPIHFLLAQKYVYAQGWWRTILKSWLLSILYSLILMFGLVVAMGLAATLG